MPRTVASGTNLLSYTLGKTIRKKLPKRMFNEASVNNRTLIDSVYKTGNGILESCPDLKTFDKIAKTKPYGIYKVES